MRTIRGVLCVIAITGFAGRSEAQDTLTHQQAVDDIRYMLGLLEETHPDPYSAFGGRVGFKREAQSLPEQVPREGMTRAQLYSLLRTFFGKLRDGHTYVSSPPSSGSRVPLRYLPVRFGIATDAVFVQGTTEGFEDLIGYRLVAVESIPIEQAAARAAMVRPSENEFAAQRWLLVYLRSNRGARRVFPDIEDGLAVRLAAPDGRIVERRLPYQLERSAYYDGPWVAERWEDIEAAPGPFYWQLVGETNVGYLRISSIVGREAYEELQAVGRQDLRDQVENYYARYLGDSVPTDIDDALERIPCFTQGIFELLTTMEGRGSEHLIVDLRGNGGGWSSLVAPFLLLVYGEEYFEYDYPSEFVTRISPSFLSLNGKSLAEYNAERGTSYELGDLVFSEENSLASRMDRTAYAKELEALGCGLADHYKELGGAALYNPQVVVLVDPATFSAAYQFMYRMWHLGAKLVGVPSSQAGNAFTDVTPYKLPNSELEGSIARSAQIFFPGDEERGRVLSPDFPMAWSDFARYGFGEQSEVRYALALIAAGLLPH